MNKTVRNVQPKEVRRKIAHNLQNELSLTLRMLSDNVWIMASPVIIMAVTAAHASQIYSASALSLIFAIAWALLLAYLFDAANQAVGAEEDRINKPYRPIPSGMATPRGMWFRTFISSFLFMVLGFVGGTISTIVSILYIATVLWVYLVAPKKWYWVWKPIANGIAISCQVNGAWAIAGQFNEQIFYVSIVCACVWAIPGQIEDARDVAGDIEQGRVTLATLFGARFVALFFASTVSLVPVVAAIVLWLNSAYSTGPAILLLVVCGLAWFVAFISFKSKSIKAYRRLFQLFCLVHIIFTTFYCAVLW